jgi:uroporphyrin-III C-methyltransferase/precorrin-2 dehydrogenase/sirohydrochlorin ferrochelatase
MYPVMLSVRGRRCLVVGGGGVALRKAEGLVAEGARVTVVAPTPIGAFGDLAAAGDLSLERRQYQSPEAGDFALAFAATDDREVNRTVFRDAEAANVWANVADDPELCNFHLPARVQRGSLQLSVASAGEAPFVVRRLRQLLERRFGAEWSEWLAAAARFRQAVLDRGGERAEREQRFDAFFGATVDPQRLTARVPTEAEEAHLLSGPQPPIHPPGKFPKIESAPPPAHLKGEGGKPLGFVSLVGAGPGDAGLLTIKGRQRMLGADAVVCDRLALTALPCDLPARVAIHGVGKEAGHHPVPQGEIGSLLVRLARQGKRVVRFKGGDPYVFGRGGEEAEVLARAHIPFEVVPGVTAGVSVPAYAGIPVTHRRQAVRVTMVTAHEAAKATGRQVRWDLLGADPHATLLGYMGVTTLPSVVAKLLAAGLSPDTPAAMIQRGTTSAQRVAISTIEQLPQAVKDQGLGPPALFVIGPTVRHAAELDWFGSRPLFGHRLVMVSPVGALGERLELEGAEVLPVPLPVTPAARLVMDALPLTGCVLQNANEVEAFDDERDGAGWSPEVVAWCLSPAAAERARQLGWTRVVEVAEPAEAEALVSALGERL